MSGIKCPPVFCLEEDDDYWMWKSDIEVWQLYTKEDKCRQGPAVYLSLKGKASDAVRGMLKEHIVHSKILLLIEEIVMKVLPHT